MIYYTYVIICTEGSFNGTYYFGKHQTKNINDRYICSSKKLANYIKKHPNGYVRIILGYYNSVEELNEAEKQLINSRINDPRCANIAEGGNGGNTGYWLNINRNSDAYKERSKKLSEAAKKRWANYSEEERKQICKTMSDNYNTHYSGHPGRVQTEAEKQKRAQSLSGKKRSEEIKKKFSEIQKEIQNRPEIKKKKSKSNIGKKRSEETRKKQSEHKKEYYKNHSSCHKGKIGISKGNIKTYIFEEQLNDYIKLGFKKGFK